MNKEILIRSFGDNILKMFNQVEAEVGKAHKHAQRRITCYYSEKKKKFYAKVDFNTYDRTLKEAKRVERILTAENPNMISRRDILYIHTEIKNCIY